MPPTELHIFAGAYLAKWRRMYGELSFGEILTKLRRRITSRLFLWYRDALAQAFRARNFLTKNAAIPAHAGGVPFQIVPEGAIAFHSWSGLRFERDELEFILRMLHPGMTFFDVGANIGLFSLAAGAKLRGKEAQLFAFEPCSATFAILEKNLALNGLTNVQTVHAAVSDAAGEAELFVNAAFKDGLNSLHDPSHTDAEVVGREAVRTVTLDDFVSAAGLARVDVMKVDVEGAERLVFRGGQKLLARPDAPLILYEGYSWCTAGFRYHPVELLWLLADCGYELFVLDSASGRVRQRRSGESFDAMVVAVKPTHPGYRELLLGKGKA